MPLRSGVDAMRHSPPAGEATRPRVLCVDDDPAVLRVACRVLAPRFDVTIAPGPAEALEIGQNATEPFAVVVSDLQMPGLSGVGLLQCFRRLAPQTVRVLLSGRADLAAAVAAVNAGEIYRFITKPFELETLIASVTEACEHHATLVGTGVWEHPSAERLAGYTRTLNALLNVTRPCARACAARVARRVEEIAATVSLDCLDDLCAAAALSQIGSASIPSELADRLYGGETLSPSDAIVAASVPHASAAMLDGVPELARVARILALAEPTGPDTPAERATAERESDQRADAHGSDTHGSDAQSIVLAARLLGAAITSDHYARHGLPIPVPLLELSGLDPAAVRRVRASLGRDDETARVRSIGVGEIVPGMVLADDVAAPNGLLLAIRGQVVSEALATRLRESCSGEAAHAQPIRVFASGAALTQ